MSVIARDRIRLALDIRPGTALVDVLTGLSPDFNRANDLQIEIAFFTNGVLADVSNIASVTLAITKGQAPPGLPLVSATTGSLNTGLTLSQWQSGDPTLYHCILTFTNSQTNIQLDGATGEQLWMVTSALTTDAPALQWSLGYGTVNIIETGAFITPPSYVETPLFYTAAQSDARYTIVNGKVSKTGDTMSGPLQFSGTTNGGLVLSNLTTTQRTALSPINGMLVLDTTLGYPFFYDGGWTGLVTSVNGSSGAVTLTTTNITEGTNLYFTGTRVLNQTLTGFTAGAGSVTSADSVLTALQKLAANAGGGTVTSVALSLPGWLSVSGSPVTTSGTLTVTATGGQTQNQVLATPNGSSGAVGLRSLVAADIPNIAQSQVTGLTTALAALAPLAGATFTGAVVLPSGTPTGQQAVSATYLASAYLALAGGTMTGALNTLDLTVNSGNSASWATAPTTANHLVNKTYADLKLALAGGTMTGNLVFSGTTIAGLRLNNLTSTQIAALTGAVGMEVYNTTLNVVQYYNGTTWITVASGAGASWFNGSGAPSNGLGNNGDYYLNTANGAIYQKSSGTWSVICGATVFIAGSTMTGDLQFTGTGHAGLVANNLTQGQINALTPPVGAIMFSTAGGFGTWQGYNQQGGANTLSVFADSQNGCAFQGASLISFPFTTNANFQLQNATTTQRNAFTVFGAGSLIWNTTTAQVEVYNGSTWGAAGGGSGTLFTSSLVSLTAGTTLINTAHSLGGTPSFVRAVLVCQTAQLSYSVGDEVDCSYFMTNQAASGFSPAFGLSANSTNVELTMAGVGSFVFVSNPGNIGVGNPITLADWKAKVYARL